MRAGKGLAGILLRDGIISQDEVEIVEYGLENLGSSLLGMSVTLMIGYCFDFLLGSFMIWLLVFPLRKNAGGYHAETKARCLLFSSAILLLSILCFQQMKWSETVYILVTVFSFLIVFVMAPIGNDNKHLDQAECKVYRRRTRMILLLEMGLFVAALTFRWKMLIVVVTMAFFIVGVSLVAGWIKLQMHKRVVSSMGNMAE